MFKVEQLPLWDVLKTVDDAQRAKVRKLIEDAAAILDHVIETFPTYTLHNSTHAENVVQLMADLLGPRRADLTPLEAALLMLSAFYHDIGMVFREDERNRLTEEPEWKTFLDTKPDAYLAVKKAGEVPLDIAEWYCRGRHADRVYVYLNRLPDELLKWGKTSIREELGELCRSHNLPAADLLKLLRTDFRDEADLRFCAVLLRLADILDFDRTRSPETVYEHLGLSRRIDPRQDASDVEWLKHLCSEGFRFPEKRPDGYQLGFVAGPDEPGVEHDVREFLTDIEGEMKQCRSVLDNCSERWRSLPLPVSIDRLNIHSNGYRYGEYRFTLDQGQVMDLLMGENLYENPYVFVRELIQNALDASRHRQFIERASGDPEFEPKPIQVRHWIDRDGYQWVRFDDEGMGMDEEIVRNHLLKVGSSYYRTASFRAEVLRLQEKTHQDFVPISRFGIGLLSCFIAGDSIEISTLRRSSVGGSTVPVRLSLNGLHGFFTLQTPYLQPLPMPAPEVFERGYRSKPGTSISVRLDPVKEKGSFELRALLKRYVACPPVPVELEGERIGGDPSILIDHPWCERTVLTSPSVQVQKDFLMRIGSLKEPIEVELLPIDLTRYSPTPELKGQILLISLKSLEIERGNAFLPHLEIDSCGEIIIHHIEGAMTLSLSIKPMGDRLHNIIRSLHTGDIIWFSHNGVAIPTDAHNSEACLIMSSSRLAHRTSVIALSDSLRPDVSISRDVLRGLPLRFYAAANLALYRALSELGGDLKSEDIELFQFIPEGLSQPPTLRDLLEDEHLYISKYWSTLPIINTNKGLQSLQEIRNSIESGPTYLSNLPFQGNRNFMNWCAATLVQAGLNVSVQLQRDPKHTERELARVLVTAGDPSIVTDGLKLFPPLTFLPFMGSRRLRSAWFPVMNANHPFAEWLIERAPEVAKRYPGLFERIRSDVNGSWNEIWEEGLEWREALKSLNATLDRLRELHPSVRPPKNLVLTENDILE